MTPVGRRARDLRDLTNQGINPVESGHHCGTGDLPAHIIYLNRGRDDSGIY